MAVGSGIVISSVHYLVGSEGYSCQRFGHTTERFRLLNNCDFSCAKGLICFYFAASGTVTFGLRADLSRSSGTGLSPNTSRGLTLR